VNTPTETNGIPATDSVKAPTETTSTATANSVKAPARSGRGLRCAPRSLRSLRCLRQPSSRSGRPLSVPPWST